MMTTFDLTYFFDLQPDFPKQDEAGEVCIANISPAERRKRLRFGIRQLIVALLVLGVMIVLHLNPLWRLLLLFIFWAAAIGYFQARDKT